MEAINQSPASWLTVVLLCWISVRIFQSGSAFSFPLPWAPITGLVRETRPLPDGPGAVGRLSKPPSPTYWACRQKVQLLAGHEMIFWLTNNPDAVRSCNQRVLQPHAESHSALVAEAENRTTIYGDGAHVVNGAFLNPLTGCSKM